MKSERGYKTDANILADAEQERASTPDAAAGQRLVGLRDYVLSDFIETRQVFLETTTTERQKLADARKAYEDAASREERYAARAEIAFFKRSLDDLLEAAKRSGFNPC